MGDAYGGCLTGLFFCGGTASCLELKDLLVRSIGTAE